MNLDKEDIKLLNDLFTEKLEPIRKELKEFRKETQENFIAIEIRLSSLELRMRNFEANQEDFSKRLSKFENFYNIFEKKLYGENQMRIIVENFDKRLKKLEKQFAENKG